MESTFQAMQIYNIDHIVPKERPKKVKFAVGMIVTFYDRVIAKHHTGVIISWDEGYTEVGRLHRYVTSPSPLFCPSFPDQPFYTILSENGNTYYTAQGMNQLLHSCACARARIYMLTSIIISFICAYVI